MKEILNNNYEQKGKYFFIQIKLAIYGYPMSGIKLQSSLLNEIIYLSDFVFNYQQRKVFF